MINPQDLYREPNALVPHYGRFRVRDRILLTGHSHQAWPDRGFEGQKQAWLDAAAHVDDKWELAFAKAETVRRGYARLLGESGAEIALGQNTHELVTRFLSALPLAARPRIVTTDGEFHSIRRQLDRLAEENIEVARVPASSAVSISPRLVDAVDDRTAAVLVSSVLFQNSHVVPGLGNVMQKCAEVGAELLVDAYHSLNVMPFSIEDLGLTGAFVTGAGYKYCQLGEGNAFLRLPRNCRMRPVITGWFAEFDALEREEHAGRVAYGAGASRFAGATYDPTSHYRAAEVFAFFEGMEMTPAFLREVSRHQIGVLAREFDALDADPGVITRDFATGLEAVAGFLVLQTPHAASICAGLRKRNVYVDYRGEFLRLGPAPYVSDAQLKDAVGILGDVIRGLR